METVTMLLKLAADVAAQWIAGSEEERAQVEARAAGAVAALRSDRESTKAAHEARVAATDAAIEKAEQG